MKVLIFKYDDDYYETPVKACFLVPDDFNDSDREKINKTYKEYIDALMSHAFCYPEYIDKRTGKIKKSVRKKYENDATYFKILQVLGYQKIDFMEI